MTQILRSEYQDQAEKQFDGFVPEVCRADALFPWYVYDMYRKAVGNLLFRTMKRRVLNIVEANGLTEKQETATKRIIIDAMHDFYNDLDTWAKAQVDYNKPSETIEGISITSEPK